MVKKTDILMAGASGALLITGFQPLDYSLITWFALVPLLTAVRDKNARAALFLGTLAGLVYFLGTIYWVSHSMYVYGNLPAAASFLILLLLCLYLALYTGVFALLFNFLSKRSRVPALLSVPVLWVALEYIRTYALTGFPWALLGYSQYRLLPLIQIADITGVYGVSFLVASLNGAVFDVLFYRVKRQDGMRLSAGWPFAACSILYAVAVTMAFFYGTEKLRESGSGQKVRVAIVQGNIEQDKKWDVKFQREVIDTYKRLTIRAAKTAPEIIVWPETALPFIFGYNKALTDEFVSFQKGLGTYLLFGSVIAKNIGADKSMMSNSAVLLSPEGNIVSIYDKIHLVPYGEYVPLRRFFPFIEKLTAGTGDFLAGKAPIVMKTPYAKIGNLICYEIIFPGLVRKFAERGADLLVTITNDAWFGRTSAPYQHFAMAVFRAIENRAPVVRAANTGISGFIDSRGRIIRKSDIFVEAVLTEDIARGGNRSLYTRYGDIFAYSCIIISVLLLAANIFSYERR